MKNTTRQVDVKSGRCGHCRKPRAGLKFLCDGCAKKHRDRQRAKECPHCEGDGVFESSDHGEIPCHVCHGEGTLPGVKLFRAINENGLAK